MDIHIHNTYKIATYIQQDVVRRAGPILYMYMCVFLLTCSFRSSFPLLTFCAPSPSSKPPPSMSVNSVEPSASSVVGSKSGIPKPYSSRRRWSKTFLYCQFSCGQGYFNPHPPPQSLGIESKYAILYVQYAQVCASCINLHIHKWQYSKIRIFSKLITYKIGTYVLYMKSLSNTATSTTTSLYFTFSTIVENISKSS